MREFITQDGNRIHMPDTAQRSKVEFEYACDCHRRLGNDFYFLPMGSCLRVDHICNRAAAEA